MTNMIIYANESNSNNNLNFMSPAVKRQSGLLHHPNHETPTRHLFKCKHQKPKGKIRQRCANKPPCVFPGTSDPQVKSRTGFPNERSMFSYIIVVCNGDVDLIQKRCSSLTWYEEWFLFFEMTWGRSMLRHEDFERVYGINHRYIKQIFGAKLSLEMAVVDSWPMFASWDEDKISQYYGENCFKGAVFVQLCGWLGSQDLWGGAVSDSLYTDDEEFLAKQQQFQEADMVDEEVIPFTNLMDKGFRGAKKAAWRRGQQLVLQPAFASSDRRFNTYELLSSASVASDRSAKYRSFPLPQ
mmetsp:Transcript_10153/g.21805  ORF Transcript_10153/g.21805 Transcript_10153/m.21805 type:complete len:297 (+) Transcript_10153:672-1562(+)